MKIAKTLRQAQGKKRCEFCHEWFIPDPRTAKIQRSCAQEDCRKKRRASAIRAWRLRNHDYNKSRCPKIREWAQSYPNYWRKYRREHPNYAKKERRRRRSAHQKAKNAAKQNTIAMISLEKLGSIRDLEPVSAAKQNAIRSQVNGILDYLFWKETVAKQDTIAKGAAHERQYEYATTNLGGDKTIEPG